MENKIKKMLFPFSFIIIFCTFPLFIHSRHTFINRNNFNENCYNATSYEYFRLNNTKNCAVVYQCVDNKLISLKCAHGLVFNIDSQVCDWKFNVFNCKKLRKTNKIEKNNCKVNEFSCKSGECLKLDVKCNEVLDCVDGSDEINCDEELDQTYRCNFSNCTLPECFCSETGKKIPNDLKPKNVPQMIMITFDDAVNINNFAIYERIFNNERYNPNGCTIKGAFFVSTKFTNFTAVEYLHKMGHEIAVHSITHNSKEEYWKKLKKDQWAKEIVGSKLIIERFANITDHSIVGMRSPMLLLGGSNQFEMLEEQSFLYDSTIVAPLSDVPFWPYTLHYQMPHKCFGKKQKCPLRSYAVWEIVMNELDRRTDLDGDNLSGCSMIDQCSNIQDSQQFYDFLENNFKRHYDSNRAPLGLFFHASWMLNEEFLDVFINWIDEKLKDQTAYFVTPTQVIQWMQSPIELHSINEFAPWKLKCNEIDVPICTFYNDCILSTHELPGQVLHLQTCMDCPKSYPWINNSNNVDF